MNKSNLKSYAPQARKDFIAAITARAALLGITADEALNGTTVLHAVSLMKGADILRVHDVKAAVEAVKLVTKVQSYE